jgi:hypothetical protein
MKQFVKLISWGTVIVVLLVLSSAPARAQEPPIKITLIADQGEYILDDPIQIQIRVFNNNYNASSGTIEPVITREGFFAQDFQNLITFIGPNGTPIKSNYATTHPEPGPPYRFQGRDLVPAEIVPPDGDNTYVLHDSKAYYNLSQIGWYEAQIRVPLEAFSEYITNAAGNLLADLNDPGKQSFNPLFSNKIYFQIIPQEPGVKTSVHGQVNLLTIGGGPTPGATKTPLINAEVRLIPLSAIPEDYTPINWKIYHMIWEWVSPIRSKLTDQYGVATFPGVVQGAYLLLAKHKIANDFKHLGALVESTNENWLTGQPIVKHLMVMQKVDGEKVPGKTKKLKGSELLITEPEYVEWDSAQETYPIVFESIGDWQVATSVTPPEGFEADYKSLDAEVTNEMETVQFTITDKGSSWKETEVKYKIKHKKKTQTLESEIGIKLSKKLAKEKGVGVYGETEIPGPFKGGKKVKEKVK